jgi:hypothetical protein
MLHRFSLNQKKISTRHLFSIASFECSAKLLCEIFSVASGRADRCWTKL